VRTAESVVLDGEGINENDFLFEASATFIQQFMKTFLVVSISYLNYLTISVSNGSQD